jgi:hypothetical protein
VKVLHGVERKRSFEANIFVSSLSINGPSVLLDGPAFQRICLCGRTQLIESEPEIACEVVEPMTLMTVGLYMSPP